jgi:hypothetical protein
MVNLFQREHPNFVAGYLSARVIIDRTAIHKAAQRKSSTPATD